MEVIAVIPLKYISRRLRPLNSFAIYLMGKMGIPSGFGIHFSSVQNCFHDAIIYYKVNTVVSISQSHNYVKINLCSFYK